MRRRPNIFEYPLGWVFSAASHVSILRALKDSREGMSGRAVANEAGINHQACAVAVKKLEAFRIIERLGSGKTQLIRLNLRHFLVQELILPLLRREREMLTRIHVDIAGAFKGVAITATIFGSVASGQSDAGSDIDLLLVAEAEDGVKVSDLARDLSGRFIRRYGFRLSQIVLTPKEVRSRFKRSDPLLKNILKNGIDILPRKLKELAL